nr:hypothetical protein Iba_chr13eCG7300 [Ipomoea batatas]
MSSKRVSSRISATKIRWNLQPRRVPPPCVLIRVVFLFLRLRFAFDHQRVLLHPYLHIVLVQSRHVHLDAEDVVILPHGVGTQPARLPRERIVHELVHHVQQLAHAPQGAAEAWRTGLTSLLNRAEEAVVALLSANKEAIAFGLEQGKEVVEIPESEECGMFRNWDTGYT